MPIPFPASHRLHEAKEFDAVFSAADHRVSSPALLFLAKRNQRGFNRLGLVVGKKNIPGAVQRNRVKRVIREAFRQTLKDHASLDVVVVARPGIREERSLFALVKSNFESLQKQAGKGSA